MTKKYIAPTLTIDLSKVVENFCSISDALPGVTIYYAVKSCPNYEIVRELSSIGCSFDIASVEEYDLCEKCLFESDKSSRIFYTHPIKSPYEIETLVEKGISDFVIDNIYELDKIPAGSNVFIRAKTIDYDCGCNLSKKFGCDISEIMELAKTVCEKEIYLKGICFHVGSQISTNLAFVDMLNCLKETYNEILSEKSKQRRGFPNNKYLSKFEILDIGGGFPYVSNNPIDINEFCIPINEELNWFIDKGIRIYAEPGRYIVANAAILEFSIIGKNIRNGVTWYYADDGIYGSFMDVALSESTVSIYPKRSDAIDYGPVVLAGPTCDSVDIISENIILPQDLSIGDELVCDNMGAYVIGMSTRFNGLYNTKICVKSGKEDIT